MASNCSWVCFDKAVLLGRYWRVKPVMLLLLPCCHGLCGSQINRYARFLGQFRMLGHFKALVIVHSFMDFQRHAVQDRAEPFIRRGCAGIAHFNQNLITTEAINKRAHPRGIVLAFDQIALPVAGHLPVFDLG